MDTTFFANLVNSFIIITLYVQDEKNDEDVDDAETLRKWGGTPLALAAVSPAAQSGHRWGWGQLIGGLRGWGVLCHARGNGGVGLNWEEEPF